MGRTFTPSQGCHLRADEAHLSAYADDWPALPDPNPGRLEERCATFVTMLADV